MKGKFILLISLLLTLSILIPNSTVQAKSLSEVSQLGAASISQKQYNQLRKLGFPEETINYLAPEEITDIINNNYKFNFSSTQNVLFIHPKDTNDEFQVPITPSEVQEYKKEKTKFVEKKIKELSVANDDFKKYVSQNKELLNSISASSQNASISYATNPVTEFIDLSLLTVTVDCYDSSSSGYIYKTFGTNFSWDYAPLWTLTDGVAVGYTGYWWTNVNLIGGYYVVDSYPQSYFVPLTTYFNGNGAWAEFDIKNPNQDCGQRGRIYIRAGNVSSMVPKSLFTVYGGYGHTKYVLNNFSISVDSTGGISFSAGIGTDVDEVQAMQPNYWTYEVPPIE